MVRRTTIVPLLQSAVEQEAQSRKHLTIDHVLPRAKGGRDKLANFVPACPACNNAKGDMTEEEFRATRAHKRLVKSVDDGSLVIVKRKSGGAA